MNQKTFRAYYVWPRFPSFSMSGTICNLHCKHCNQTYLKDMQPVTTPSELYNLALYYAKHNAVGFLLSGGCKPNGKMINLPKLLPIIKKIKDETNLIIKLHTGLVDQKLAERIVHAGVDVASLEIVGSQSTINTMYQFDANPDTYAQSLDHLEKAGMPHIVPHICIGLDHGSIQGEFHALDIIKESCIPSVIVMIILRPTKHTPFASLQPPKPHDISTVIAYAKQLFPQIDISLGCMRPRNSYRQPLESAALHAGVNRMEIPSKTTLFQAKQMGYTIKYLDACCALPQEFEKHAVSQHKT